MRGDRPLADERVLHGDPATFVGRGLDPSRLRARRPQHLDVDPENVERGLARLVLAVIELLRQLIERQAVRRVEGGSLKPDEVERLGRTLRALNERMAELRDLFGLERNELDLAIGRTQDLLGTSRHDHRSKT